MKNIVYPTSFFDRPFADTGNKQVIPETTATAGRASLTAGFPTETQLPIAQGGVAPNRLDFNGALYMLSAMAFWQQSGGQWKWSNALNYAVPCVVYHNGILWWAIAVSGPQSGTGAIEPGTNDRIWREFWNPEGGGTDGNPIGTIIMFHGITPPDGYLSCDGSTFSATTYPLLYAQLGKSTTPDMRGMFVRGYDPAGINDPDGSNRGIGIRQEDAMRNIRGSIYLDRPGTSEHSVTLVEEQGAFYAVTKNYQVRSYGASNNVLANIGLGFDASKDPNVLVSTENRSKNINLLYCIKHD